MSDLFMDSDAVFSPCGTYRLRLSRIWDPRLPLVAFGMLNPSKAGKKANDPTSRRCIGFATTWGYGGLIQVNMYGLRGADPTVLLHHPDPIGPDNDATVLEVAREVDLFVAAWGANKAAQARHEAMLEMLSGVDVHYLRLTKSGYPEHPLYLPGNLTPTLYAAPKGGKGESGAI